MNIRHLIFGMAIYGILALVVTIHFFSKSSAPNDEQKKIFLGNSKGMFYALKEDADPLNKRILKTRNVVNPYFNNNVDRYPPMDAPKANKASLRSHTDKFIVQVQDDGFQSEIFSTEDNQQIFTAMRAEILGQIRNTQPSNHFSLVNYQRYRDVNPYKKLGLYEYIPNLASQTSTSKRTKRYGILHDESYCEQVDLYNLIHQDRVFSQFTFITDFTGSEATIMQSVLDQQGTSLIPDLRDSHKNHVTHQLPFYLNAELIKYNTLLKVYEFNKEINCFSQIHNHIPGMSLITRKDFVTETLVNYTQRYASQPECLEGFKYPQSYRLSIKEECDAFFDYINSDNYAQKKKTQPLQYLLKEGYNSHRADGVFLFDEERETSLRSQFANGSKCGDVLSSLVAQQYISNPLLLDRQNKFDFRIYMLVTSAKPLIVYYHDGFLRVSLSKYDLFSQDKNVHLTNTHLSKAIFESTKQNQSSTVTEDELRDYQMWTLEDLQDYLLKTNKISDKNWLANHLRPKFKQAFAHLSRAIEKSIPPTSNVYELFGLDFVMDENLDIWFIECNVSPQLIGTNARKTQLLTKMLQDMYEIQLAYYRSRMTRAFNFVNKIMEENDQESDIKYDQLRNEFDTVINTNRLELDFQISKNNGFVLVTDKNLPERDAYFGNIKQECLAF